MINKKVSISFLKPLIIAGVFAMSALVTGCLDEDGDPALPNLALVSFYHCAPNVNDLDIIVDGQTKVNDTPVGYGEYSDYLAFYTGQRDFEFVKDNNDDVLIDTTLTLLPNKTYSVFVANPLDSVQAVVLLDSAAAPDEGKAMIRFVHLSPDSPGLDIYIADQKTFPELNYKSGTEFKEIAAGKKTLEFKTFDGTSEVLLTVPNVEIKSREYYTVVLQGFATPPTGITNGLETEIINN